MYLDNRYDSFARNSQPKSSQESCQATPQFKLLCEAEPYANQ